jgi:glucosamine--fructose-6-phosphate aminotransferase (isomerizing)
MPTILEQEIDEQPDVLEGFLASAGEPTRRVAAEISRRGVSYIMIAARGSSDNAARYAQYLFGARNHLPVALATPSLYTLYDSPPRLEGALIIGISQSGRSPDIVSVMETARAQSRPCLAITNDPASPMALAADWIVPLATGEERAVAATKTYTTSLGALALLSASLSGEAAAQADLARIPGQMRLALSQAQGIGPLVERYRYAEGSAVIGRGFNYGTAFEIALKVKELTRLVIEPYSSADFLHGPISILEPGFPLIIVAPTGRTLPDLDHLAGEALQRGAELIVISDDSDLLQRARTPLPLPPNTPEWLSPLVTVLPGQLFAAHLARAKGFDLDRPAGLSKVTQTR